MVACFRNTCPVQRYMSQSLSQSNLETGSKPENRSHRGNCHQPPSAQTASRSKASGLMFGLFFFAMIFPKTHYGCVLGRGLAIASLTVTAKPRLGQPFRG